jgi:hypothetical protein
MVYGLGRKIARTAESQAGAANPDLAKQYMEAFRQTPTVCNLMTRLGAPPALISQVKHARLTHAHNILLDFKDVKYAEEFLDAASPLDQNARSCFPPYQGIRADWPRSPVSVAREKFQDTLDTTFKELTDKIQQQTDKEQMQTDTPDQTKENEKEDEKESTGDEMDQEPRTGTGTPRQPPTHPQLATPTPETRTPLASPSPDLMRLRKAPRLDTQPDPPQTHPPSELLQRLNAAASSTQTPYDADEETMDDAQLPTLDDADPPTQPAAAPGQPAH